jgi:uncharacterized membrane protein
MDTPAIVIMSLYGLGFIIMVILLIYLIFRRIHIKESEDFEKRNN